jgi:hypothetical protein
MYSVWQETKKKKITKKITENVKFKFKYRTITGKQELYGDQLRQGVEVETGEVYKRSVEPVTSHVVSRHVSCVWFWLWLKTLVLTVFKS